MNVFQPAFVIPNLGDPIAAENIGVGADGTTLVLSNVPTDTADGGIFFTGESLRSIIFSAAKS